MTLQSLLQTFALNNQDELVSIEEVDRGLACDCTCPQCGDPMIARQGDIRAWHFAHANESECPGGAETALHLAAKTILQRNRALQLPGLHVIETATAEDGRTSTAERVLPERKVSFVWVILEQQIEDIRADVCGMITPNDGMLIEIAVTHVVDETKREKLRNLRVHALEIHLDAWLHEAWTWSLLEEEVVDAMQNKEWLYHSDEERLRLEALQEARQELEPDQLPTDTPTTNQPLDQKRYVIQGHLFILYRWPDNLVLWKKGWIHTEIFTAFSQLIWTLGGRWRSARNNWRIPGHLWDVIQGELECAVMGELPDVQRAIQRVREGWKKGLDGNEPV